MASYASEKQWWINSAPDGVTRMIRVTSETGYPVKVQLFENGRVVAEAVEAREGRGEKRPGEKATWRRAYARWVWAQHKQKNRLQDFPNHRAYKFLLPAERN